jgi:hypothetical protein
MRVTLLAIFGLGLLVAALGLLDRAAQIDQWSSLFELAAQTRSLEYELVFHHLDRIPRTPYTVPIVAVGLATSCLAMWQLLRRPRP